MLLLLLNVQSKTIAHASTPPSSFEHALGNASLRVCVAADKGQWWICALHIYDGILLKGSQMAERVVVLFLRTFITCAR